MTDFSTSIALIYTYHAILGAMIDSPIL